MSLFFVILVIVWSAGFVMGHIAGHKQSAVKTISLWVLGMGLAYVFISIFEGVMSYVESVK